MGSPKTACIPKMAGQFTRAAGGTII